MDVLLSFGPNWKRNDEEMIEKFQSYIMVVKDKMADVFFSNQENETKLLQWC